MALNNGLLIAQVAHTRTLQKRNAFCYGVYYLALSLDHIASLRKLALMSVNAFNLFSFYNSDHGLSDDSNPQDWVKSHLAKWNIHEADGEIVMVTLPRLFGHVFNPVSFWFCLDSERRLRAVLSEVCNTFGDTHSYLSFHDDHRPIGKDDILRSEKIFYVSPFLDVSGYYQFRFDYREGKIGVWIDHYDANGLTLTTSITGKRIPLTSLNLLYYFFRFPLVTFKVIGLIHYQAFKLWCKGIRYRPHPQPPTTEVSR